MSQRFAVLCLWAASGALASAQVVSVWLTTDDQKSLMAPQPAVEFAPGTSSQLPSIFISESQAEQTIEGFGASMTDSAAYLLNEVVPKTALGGVMQSLFSRSQGIGVSFLRNPMGASDLTRYDYSYDDLSYGATDPNSGQLFRLPRPSRHPPHASCRRRLSIRRSRCWGRLGARQRG